MPQSDPSDDIDSYVDAVRKALDASAGGDYVPDKPTKDYESDPREREFEPATETKYQFRDKLGLAPEPFNIDKSRPDSYRLDGTLKGRGHLGPIKTSTGQTMTEKSIGVDGKLIPALVPTLTPEEIKLLGQGSKPTKSIVDKAKAYAAQRAKRGMQPFANAEGYADGGEVGDPYLKSWASMDYPMTSGNLSGIAPVSVEPPLRLPNYLDQYPEELQDAHNKLLDKFIDGKITKAEFHKKRDAMGISDYLIRGSSKLNKSMEEFSGYRRGGELTGPPPSSPFKDNLTIKAQAGEYVVPKKVVDVLGSNYFDDMVTQITGKKPMPKPKGQTFTPGPSSNSPAFQTGGKVGAEGQTGDGWQPPASLPGTTGYNSDNNIYTNPEWQPKLSNPMIGWSGGNDGKPPSAFFENKGLQQYWHDYYDNPRNHYAGNWAGNPDDMVQINRGNRGGPGMAGLNDMANELGKRRQGRGGGRFSGPVFNQRSNLSDRPAGGYPLLQGYPQGSAPWDYGQNPSGVWGNAGNYNVSGESHRAGQDAMAFAGNTWGQGIVHDPEVGMWRNENRPIAGQHWTENNPRFAMGRNNWLRSQREGRAMLLNRGFFRGPQYGGGNQPAIKIPQSTYPVAAAIGKD